MTEQIINQTTEQVAEQRQDVALIKDLADGVMTLCEGFEQQGYDFVSIAATLLFLGEGLRNQFPFLNDIQFEHRPQEVEIVEQGDA